MKILPDWSTLVPALDRLGAQPAPMITHLDDGQPLAALPIEKIVAHVHRVCREYNHEIDASVANWSLGELLPECSWKALAWRRQRIGAAHSFLMFLNPFTRRPSFSAETSPTRRRFNGCSPIGGMPAASLGMQTGSRSTRPRRASRPPPSDLTLNPNSARWLRERHRLSVSHREPDSFARYLVLRGGEGRT